MTYRPLIAHSIDPANPRVMKLVQCRTCGEAWHDGYPTRHTCPTDAQPTTFEAELVACRDRLRQTLDLLDRVAWNPCYRMTPADLRQVREACAACGMEMEWTR
jgi:hypothetical protein